MIGLGITAIVSSSEQAWHISTSRSTSYPHARPDQADHASAIMLLIDN